MVPKKPTRRAASPTGGVPMESMLRIGEVPDFLAMARDLYTAEVNGWGESLERRSETDEREAAWTALRRALVFAAMARGFLDGNVVG